MNLKQLWQLLYGRSVECCPVADRPGSWCHPVDQFTRSHPRQDDVRYWRKRLIVLDYPMEVRFGEEPHLIFAEFYNERLEPHQTTDHYHRTTFVANQQHKAP